MRLNRFLIGEELFTCRRSKLINSRGKHQLTWIFDSQVIRSYTLKPQKICFRGLTNVFYFFMFWEVCRGYYTVARRYEFYVQEARTISHSFAALTREILFLPREHKIHIFEPTCDVLFIIWRNQFNKSKRRESWRHWTIWHSQRWHTENTPLGSRMKWRMESTSGLVPSKTLSSI